MFKLVLASSNKGKIVEINQLMQGRNMVIIPQADAGVDDIEETGASFIENALLKARHAAAATHLPALADDSGLVVPALNGEPGIYSARYAGPDANYMENIQQLLSRLKGIPPEQRDAFFYCAIVFVEHALDPCPILCEGSWHGRILSHPRGDNGFGYDSIFYDPVSHLSAAELQPDVKSHISHRGQAMRILLQRLSDRYGA